MKYLNASEAKKAVCEILKNDLPEWTFKFAGGKLNMWEKVGYEFIYDSNKIGQPEVEEIANTLSRYLDINIQTH